MFCPRCRQENDAEAQFCQGCGTSLKKLGQESRIVETKTAVQYAGFWRRCVAAFIDVALTHVVFVFFILMMVRLSWGEFIPVVWLVIPWIYSAVMESSSKQATLGEMALGIVVTDLEGGRISFGKATGRHFCKILSVLSLSIGFIMAGFTQKKQALHDMMTNCLLVLRESNALMAVAKQVSAHNLNARLREQRTEHQRLEQEMEAAREMQLSLLPQSAPQIEGFDIAGVCEPATEVGGDYFTYLWMEEGKNQLGIVLMDVTGHGMKAATTTFLANGMLQSEIRTGKPPGEIMKNMHQSLQGVLPKNSFVAMSFALINTYDKSLTHFNAGLPAPILIRNGKSVELDIQSSLPLGCRLPAEYVGTSIPLISEDVLLLLSDGLTEAEDGGEQMYQYARMPSLLDSLAAGTQTAQAWLDSILTDVRLFSESKETEDDLTVVVVRIL